jgi:hypothetical protein
LLDKHYTRLEVKSQTNFWKLVNIFFDRINRIDPPEAGEIKKKPEKCVKKSEKNEIFTKMRAL